MGDYNTQTEKLEKSNYQPGEFRISNFLMGKGLRWLVSGTEVKAYVHPDGPTEDQRRVTREWDGRDTNVIFILAQHINNSIIGHIQDLNTSKKVWECLERLYSTSTKARKIQLKNELNNLRNSSNHSINVFILKIKRGFGCTWFNRNHVIDDDDLLGHTFNSLKENDKWKTFTTLCM